MTVTPTQTGCQSGCVAQYPARVIVCRQGAGQLCGCRKANEQLGIAPHVHAKPEKLSKCPCLHNWSCQCSTSDEKPLDAAECWEYLWEVFVVLHATTRDAAECCLIPPPAVCHWMRFRSFCVATGGMMVQEVPPPACLIIRREAWV